MALKELINNQTIRIDNHNRGVPLEWEKRLHIHKYMDEGSKSNIGVEIYFADDKPLVFSQEKGVETRRLQKEIRKAFSDSVIRKKFILSFYEEITPIIECNRAASDMRRVAKRAARRIAEQFDLGDDIELDFMEGADLIFTSFRGGVIATDFAEKAIWVSQRKEDISEWIRR